MFIHVLRVGGALAFAALIAPSTPLAGPGPGLQYDEIVRVVTSGTPPPPGGFQSDLAAAQAAPPQATPAPHRRFGLGNIASAVLSGNPNAVAGAAAGAVIDASVESALSGTFSGLAAGLSGFLRPHVFRYAYLNGWERVDDLTAQTATITKCDIGQVVHLDLARRSYTLTTPGQDDAPPANAAPQRARPGTPVPVAPAPPGTALVTLTATTRALGAQQIEGQRTNGYDATTTFAMSQATGSCRNGSASFESVQYLAPIAQPSVLQCPIRRRPIPEQPADTVPQAPSGGCRPTFTARSSGTVPPPGRLSLYTFLRMSAAETATPAPGSAAGGIGFLTERGNLRTLGAPDAGLFEIPPGYTKG